MPPKNHQGKEWQVDKELEDNLPKLSLLKYRELDGTEERLKFKQRRIDQRLKEKAQPCLNDPKPLGQVMLKKGKP